MTAEPDNVLIDFYCPACGETGKVPWHAETLYAGDHGEVTCPNCETRYQVRIGLWEWDALFGGET